MLHRDACMHSPVLLRTLTDAAHCCMFDTGVNAATPLPTRPSSRPTARRRSSTSRARASHSHSLRGASSTRATRASTALLRAPVAMHCRRPSPSAQTSASMVSGCTAMGRLRPSATCTPTTRQACVTASLSHTATRGQQVSSALGGPTGCGMSSCCTSYMLSACFDGRSRDAIGKSCVWHADTS